jgi:nucleotide-binding universal stress UspA family protein
MLKDILIHMDRGTGCTARLMAAIDLAHRHGALLKGLYAIAPPHYASSSDYMSDYGEVREFFINATSKAGVAAEWLLSDLGVTGTQLYTIITRHAYYCDVVLLGQPVYMKNRKSTLQFHEHVLLLSGRPAIIFPASGDLFRLGNRILVAWKGGRESVRAVHDLIPLLQQGSELSVVSFVRNRDEQAVEWYSMNEMLDHLARHGVQATAETVMLEKAALTDAVLEYSRKTDAEMIALGGFSHSPGRSPALSPLAADLLVRSDLPLVIGH